MLFYKKGGGHTAKRIIINQVGYGCSMPKTAVCDGTADEFRVVDAKSRRTVYCGHVGDPVEDKASGDIVSLIDFSELNRSGRYYIRVGTRRSKSFTVAEKPYGELKRSMLKSLYYNRCGTLDKRFAGEFAHPACHSDLVPLFSNPSKRRDVTGGWHDSGGYGRYAVCTAITLGHLLYAYKFFPNSFSEQTGIPESGNGLPDIINECRVGLDWLLKMQDRDGGVHHKVAAQKHVPVVLPHNDDSQKYIFPCSHQAAACFCAVTALASRVMSEFDSGYADRLREASLNAWIWLMNNPTYEPFENPPTVVVSAAGDFYDDNPDDEMFWAACELYEITGEKAFHDRIMVLYPRISASGFVNRENGGFGAMAYLFGTRPRNPLAEEALRLQLRIRADNLYGLSGKSAYGTAKSEEDYIRGSNMYSMTDCMTLILAYKLFGCDEYLRTVCEQVNYILGKNPLNICYVTGFGHNRIMHPHHRPSEADSVEEPVPGMLVCGPNSRAEDGFSQWNIPPNAPPAKCYYDILYSFSTNESTIYCNSAAIFVLGYLESEDVLNR